MGKLLKTIKIKNENIKNSEKFKINNKVWKLIFQKIEFQIKKIRDNFRKNLNEKRSCNALLF